MISTGIDSQVHDLTVAKALECGARFHYHDRLAGDVDAALIRLYRAERDFRPAGPVEADGRLWRHDRVVWSGADLPTGELKRSIGHWNPESQEEEFSCRSGIIWMLFHGRDEREIFLVKVCEGESVSAPPGWWHLTYVDSFDATVENRYTHSEEVRGDKYSTGKAAPLTLIRADGGSLSALNVNEMPVRLLIKKETAVPAFEDAASWTSTVLKPGESQPL